MILLSCILKTLEENHALKSVLRSLRKFLLLIFESSEGPCQGSCEAYSMGTLAGWSLLSTDLAAEPPFALVACFLLLLFHVCPSSQPSLHGCPTQPELLLLLQSFQNGAQTHQTITLALAPPCFLSLSGDRSLYDQYDPSANSAVLPIVKLSISRMANFLILFLWINSILVTPWMLC